MENRELYNYTVKRIGNYVYNNGELYHARGCNQYQHRCRGTKNAKFGTRRYQNKDGTYTEAGWKRYDRDVRENNAKKKDNRIYIDGPDPQRWVREDIERTKKAVDTSSDLVRQAKSIERETRPTPVKKKMDLSNMTDQQLRDRINRANLERQYNDLFGEPAVATVSKGRAYAQKTLEVAGDVLAIGGSALGIALAIKQLTDT